MPSPNVLVAKHVRKAFGGVHANSDICLNVRQGERLGLIGPNGSGKSTFLNVLAGFYRADAGVITWRGQEIQRLSAHQIAKLGIARTFQDFKLFLELTTLENVMVGALLNTSSVSIAKIAAGTILNQVGLGDKTFARADTLSTGQRKRLELARCLALSPGLLLLDEPLAGVDPGNRPGIIALLNELVQTEELTIVLVEHDPDVIKEFCTHVVAFDQGRVLVEGTPAEVYASQSLRQAYMEG